MCRQVRGSRSRGRPAMTAGLPTSALPPTPATCMSGSQFGVGCLGESDGTFFPFSEGSHAVSSLSVIPKPTFNQ